MGYVFDTSSFIVLSHFFPKRFPTFWDKFDACVRLGQLVSVREVRRELTAGNAKDHLESWIDRNGAMFRVPTPEETSFVSRIFSVPMSTQMVRKKQLLSGMPVADPFVIASAFVGKSCVVTEESMKPNSAQIPNVCQYFNIECTNLEGFMERGAWEF